MDTLFNNTDTFYGPSVVWLSSFLVCLHWNYNKWKWKIFGHTSQSLRDIRTWSVYPQLQLKWDEKKISYLPWNE